MVQQCFKTLQLSFECNCNWQNDIKIFNEQQNSFELNISDNKVIQILTQFAIQDNISLSSCQRIQIFNDEQEQEVLKLITILAPSSQTIQDFSFLSLDNFKSVSQLNIWSESNFGQISQLNEFKNICKISFLFIGVSHPKRMSLQFYKLKYLVQLSYKWKPSM
ncbi:hypothetical protein ABPG72_006441 [Tetrahymena utriculariae]